MSEPSSESLAAVIISNRLLGLFSDQAKICMSELLRRREDEGDLFKFEEYIDNQIKIIQDENEKAFANNGLMSLLSSISKVGKI